MRHFFCFICLIIFSGCDSEIEQRRQHTLERMDYTDGGGPESVRTQQLIVSALEQADTASLQSPQLVSVIMNWIPNDTKQRGLLRLNWISAQPGANGARILFGNGTQGDIPFDEVDIQYNKQEAADLVLFSANPFAQRDHSAIWEKLLTDLEAEIILIQDGEVVSNKQSIRRINPTRQAGINH